MPDTFVAIAGSAWGAINIITLTLFGMDKLYAKRGGRRIPERTLMGFTGAFGALGALLGMLLFRHKTRHRLFSVGVPVLLVLQSILVLILVGFAYLYASK